MDFSNVKSITIPEGKVKRILSGSTVLWQAGRIPSEYQEVEYILKDHDNTYMDLGFSFDSACVCYMDISKTTSQYGYFFGAAEKSGVLRFMITGNAYFQTYGSTGSEYFIVGLFDANELSVMIEARNGLLRVTNLSTGETKASTSQGEFTMTNNLLLFGQNYNGSPRAGNINTMIKSFSYYDKNNTLICELIPCYRKADGEVGMYDRVRKKFLTNATGTFSFMKGADV